MSSTVIQYYIKSVYGVDRLYVSDPVQADALYALTGQKTISWCHVSALERLGFRIVQVIPPGNPLIGKSDVIAQARDHITDGEITCGVE